MARQFTIRLKHAFSSDEETKQNLEEKLRKAMDNFSDRVDRLREKWEVKDGKIVGTLKFFVLGFEFVVLATLNQNPGIVHVTVEAAWDVQTHVLAILPTWIEPEFAIKIGA